MEVRAIRDCFVDGSFRHEDEKFDYSGPKNSNLEPVKQQDSKAAASSSSAPADK